MRMNQEERRFDFHGLGAALKRAREEKGWTQAYCERPVKYGEQRCREIGAFRQWTKKQTDDPIFKAYRKEYKKRFAWIKAGRITDEQFYAWSEKAREEKKKCDRDIISLEDFQQWLRDSKI